MIAPGRIFTEADVMALLREMARQAPASEESTCVIAEQLLGELDADYPADEPVLVFRGRDPHSIRAARAYVMACAADDEVGDDYLRAVRACKDALARWQTENLEQMAAPS